MVDRDSGGGPAGRRDFLRVFGLGAIGSAVMAGCARDASGDQEAATTTSRPVASSAPSDGEASSAGTGEASALDMPEITWDMTSSFVESLSTLWASNVYFADRVTALTGGRFTIVPHQAGELTGPLEVLGAVRDGTAPAGITASYYYLADSPITAFGTALPFGLTTRQQYSWLYAGGGLELLQGLYATKFNIIQFPVASTGAQMGGWFNREILSLDDLRGLKMRIPGLGGQVMTSLGVETQTIGAGDIAAALESGTVDAAEFIGPADDQVLALQDSATYYYYPGFWEPCATAELQVNLDEWNALPPLYQDAIRSAASESTMWTMALYDARNGQALNDLVAGGTELRAFPKDVLQAAQAASGLLLDEIAASDADFALVLEHWRSFRRQVVPWFSLAEAALLQ